MVAGEPDDVGDLAELVERGETRFTQPHGVHEDEALAGRRNGSPSPRVPSLPVTTFACTRRDALLSFAALATGCAPAASSATAPASVGPVAAARNGTTASPTPAFDQDGALAAIEASVGGRVGVFALDTANGRALAHREDERFPMCSTFKWVLVAAVLHRVDRGGVSLEDRVPYGPADLLEYAPLTKAHVNEGALSVAELARAAVTASDNTAANLLLAKVGGPPGFTSFCRDLGDPVTRLDRTEPALNESLPGDPRDTTSPEAMVALLRTILCGDVLSRPARDRLLGWMQACDTGRDRLRAGLPADWTIGDKTGTGRNGSCNDVAIALPPGRAPVLIAAYLSDSRAQAEDLAAAHRAIGALVGTRLTLGQLAGPRRAVARL